MTLLLDTHVLLWWLANDPKLSGDHRALVADSSHAAYVSSVSIAEIAIKASLGKLEAPEHVREAVLASGLSLLPFDAVHAEELRALPWTLRDPFDRMLIAQARVEKLVLLTVDERIRKYDVNVR